MGSDYHSRWGWGILGAMAAPRGKGIYARSRFLYPNADPAAYARAMGCDFVVFLDNVADAAIHRAHELGLHSYLYALPEDWVPSRWQATLEREYERAVALGMQGIVADPEGGWGSAHAREATELGAGLASAARGLHSVGITSYPTWRYADEVAAESDRAGVWGSPQLYGILEPASDSELYRRSLRWRQLFSQVVPSLAAWGRDPSDQALYLQTFNDESGAILWQSTNGSGTAIQPAIGSEAFQVLEHWRPMGGPERRFLDVLAERVVRPLRLRRG